MSFNNSKNPWNIIALNNFSSSVFFSFLQTPMTCFVKLSDIFSYVLETLSLFLLISCLSLYWTIFIDLPLTPLTLLSHIFSYWAQPVKMYFIYYSICFKNTHVFLFMVYISLNLTFYVFLQYIWLRLGVIVVKEHF